MTSGNDGQKLTDGDTNTCVNIQPQDGAVLQYELNLNEACSHDNHVFVNATVPMETNCCDLETIFINRKADKNCANNTVKMTRCKIIESHVDEGNRMCSLKCECAESAKTCHVNIYSSVKPVNVQICEIKAEN